MKKRFVITTIVLLLLLVIGSLSYKVLNHVKYYEHLIAETNRTVHSIELYAISNNNTNYVKTSDDMNSVPNTNIYVDSDSVVAVLTLEDKDSFVVIKREPDESQYAVACEAFIDFQNKEMGFYKAAIPKDETREVYSESHIDFEIQEGHQYTILFVKENGLNIKLCLTDDYTGENTSMQAITSDVGSGWGKRFIECKSGSVKIHEFYNLSTQPQNSKVLIIGDSFIEGASLGAQKDKRYAMLIKDSLSGDVFINGQGGAASYDGVTWLNTYLMDIVNPQYAIVAFGMNESDIDSWKANMGLITEILENNNINPIFVTITPSKREGYNNEIHMEMNEYIRQSGYQYIDAAKACSLNNDGVSFDESLFFGDKVHPTIEAHKLIFEQACSDVPELFE